MKEDHVFYSTVDPAEGTRHYILPGLDGLRAVAVLAVLLYHLWPGILPGGMAGVDVFFVISGYLITALLLREAAYTGRMNIVSFWVRRARRLFPAIVVLVATVGSMALLVRGDVQVGLGRQVLGAFTFSSNWLYIASNNDYFAQTSPELLTNFWSLAVEEQFYIFWPVVVVLLFMSVSRWSRRVAVPAALGLLSLLIATILALTGASPSRIYYGTDTHLFGLMIGVILALLIPWSMYPPSDRRLYTVVGYGHGAAGLGRTLLGWFSLAGLIALCCGLSGRSPFVMPWGLLLASLLSAGIIQALFADVHTRGARLLRGLLSLPPLVWIGKRSYGIYLWHWPLYVFAHYIFGADAGHGAMLLVLTGTLVIAGLSYMYVEEPVRTLGFGGALAAWYTAVRGAATLPTVGAAALVLGLGATGVAVSTAPGMTEAEAVVAAGSTGSDRLSQTDGQDNRGSIEATDIAPVSIIGDSVTVASTGSLHELLPQASIDAEVSRTLSQALPALEHKAAEGKLGTTVVISLATNSTMSTQIIDDTVAQLSPTGERTIIFVTGVAPANLTWVEQSNRLIREAADKYPGTVAVADWAAAAAGHSDYLVSDGVHPTEAGQRVYAQTIADAVEAARHR